MLSRTKTIIAVLLIIAAAIIVWAICYLNKIEEIETVTGGTLVEIPLWEASTQKL